MTVPLLDAAAFATLAEDVPAALLRQLIVRTLQVFQDEAAAMVAPTQRRAAAHRLAGAAGMYACPRLARAAREIEATNLVPADFDTLVTESINALRTAAEGLG
ncbi:MAG: Hpt domain-containing protein [Alphaproteobacteria bacterium]|nr:Hpt domain-containing protein [Alphaproteobacteria bacterium]